MRRPRRPALGALGRGGGPRLVAASAGRPAAVAAHSLNPTYTSRLPLAVYLAGAAPRSRCRSSSCSSATSAPTRPIRRRPAVCPGPAASRPARRRPGRLALDRRPGDRRGDSDGRGRDALPVGLRLGRRGLDLGPRRADLAVAGPVLDPVRHRRLGRARARRPAWEPAEYPARLGRWPAVDRVRGRRLARAGARGRPQVLFIVLVGYTALTLAMMAQYGRDTWRANGETFTVWFRLLGRLAPYALVDETGRVRRRSFASGLLEPGWTVADVVLVALGGRLDPLRRAVADADLVRGCSGARRADRDRAPRRVPRDRRGCRPGRRPGSSGSRRRAPACCRSRRLPDRPLPDVPAHRRPAIVIAVSDPFQQGWDLFGTAFYVPTARGYRRVSCGPSSSPRSSAGTCSARGAATSSRRWTRRPGLGADRSPSARSRSRS